MPHVMSKLGSMAVINCRWLEPSNRLQLEYLKAKAMDFIKDELSEYRAAFLSDQESMGKLTTATMAEIMSMMSAVIESP